MSATFAERLAHLRATKGLTQRDLGAAAGVAWSMISKYEAGKSTPRLKVLMKLAEALGVSVEDLQGGDPDRPSVELYEGFSARLLELRCKKKISTRLLAKRTGIDVSVLMDFELGEVTPSTNDIYSLAEALEVSVSDLAGEKDEAETVRLRVSFDGSTKKPITVPATEASYQTFLEVAQSLGIKPDEMLARILIAVGEAAHDPENADPIGLDILNSMKFEAD